MEPQERSSAGDLAPPNPPDRPPLRIPDGTQITFVGEGAANAVFALSLPEGRQDVDYARFRGKLLRVPKHRTSGGAPYGLAYIVLQSHWEQVIWPLFRPEDLVQQELVLLPVTGANGMNAVLAEREAAGQRRRSFVGDGVAPRGMGMLVEDMRSAGPDHVTVEFKPKWLAQSPTAPKNAVRCRNCAREAFRRAEGTSWASALAPESAPIFCPLKLLLKVHPPETRAEIARQFGIPEGLERRFMDWLEAGDLLPRLRNLQVARDPVGPLYATDDDAGFGLAMTLRDCTCFVRIPRDPARPVVAKLGDLDQKHAAVKARSWVRMERHLTDAGFYQARELPRQATDCALAPRNSEL